MQLRERFVEQGASTIGDAELVALIFGTGAGGRSSMAIAAGLLERFDGLAGLARAEVADVAGEPGVGPVRAIKLLAALDLGRRSVRAEAVRPIVRSAEDAWERLRPALAGLGDEELHAIYLDRRHQVVGQRRLTRGTDGFTVVDPRQVFRPAVGMGACAVIIAHNHPSGDPTPSAQDRDVTRRVAAAGKVLGIVLLDHLVIGGNAFVSLAAEGILPRWCEEPVVMA
jgi:DNA repair protein RadC